MGCILLPSLSAYNGDVRTEGGQVADSLKDEFEYYLEHQDEIVEKYDGKYVAIKDGIVLGAYDDEITAINDTQKSHRLGSFLIQKVSRGTSAYTQTFHSRVVIP